MTSLYMALASGWILAEHLSQPSHGIASVPGGFVGNRT